MLGLDRTFNVDFVSKSPIFVTVSGLLVLLALILFATLGLNYGIDFAGGTELQIKFNKPVMAADIRDALKQVNMNDARVQAFGDVKENEFLIRVAKSSVDPSQFDAQLTEVVKRSIGKDNALVRVRYSGDKAYLKLQNSVESKVLKDSLQTFSSSHVTIYDVAVFGKLDDHEYVINFGGISKLITKSLTEKFGAGAFELRRDDTVGPKVGKELRTKSAMALLVTLVLLLIFIAFRFDFSFAPGAILCLFHDAVITLGFFCVMRIQVDLSVLAAILTLVGYSLNDTIVVYDRIRENMQRMQGADLSKIINDSINQTLSRTLMTSGATMLVALSLLLFGGEIIHNFALALTFGIVAGSYSTIYIASPLTIILNKYFLKKA